MRNRSEGRVGHMRRDDGYTLTEILVVMAIIGVIAAVLTPGLISQLGRARAKTTQVQLETIAAGVEMFRSDVGRYPNKTEGLGALIVEPGDADGWTGPYLKGAKVLKDHWGNAIAYEPEATGLGFHVTSYGADGKAEGVGLNKDLHAPSQ